MKIGDEVYKKIEFGMESGTNVPPQRGIVTYIHPKRRFYRVKFSFPWGGEVRRFSQCYPLRNRITASTSDVRPEPLSERPKHPRGAVDQISRPVEQGAYFPVKKQRRKKRKK